MSSLDLGLDEVVLVHGQCLDLRQPMAYAGVLTITNKRVHFRPSRLNLAIGASSWEFSLARIEAVTLGGFQKAMTIAAGPANMRLIGRDVSLLYDRLSALVDDINGENKPSAAFEPGERVLLCAEVAVEMNALLWVTGMVTLTDRRFRFAPRRALDRLIWQTAGIDAPLSIIRAGNLDVVRKRLQLRIKNQIYVFRGGILPRLYAFMNVLARDGGISNLISLDEAALHRGPLAQRGELAITSSRLLFVSSGAIEAVVGTREELDIELREVRRMELQGAVEPRFVVQMPQERHEFSLANAADRLMSMVPALMQCDGWDDPPVSGDAHTLSLIDAERMMEQWLPRLGGEASLVMLCGPAVHLSSKPGVRRGWLVLTTAQVVFIPMGGARSPERPVLIDSKHLIPPMEEDETSAQLLLRAEGVSVRIIPRGGAEFVERFWDLWRDERLKLLEATRDRIRARRAEQKKTARGDGFNRREVFRVIFPTSRSCVLTVAGSSPGELSQHIETEAVNMSEGGVCVFSPESLRIDQEVLVRFQDGPVGGILPGRVVHYRKMGKNRYRLGVEFIDLEIDLQLDVRDVVMDIQREDLALRAERLKG